MSAYVPLAVKYRPQRFCEVVGQDTTVRIITGGIRKNRLGPALLFSGARGVGKTTIARILAKALRCENRDADNPEPCCRCDSCLNFSRDGYTDVIEMDAASNTGVDDVREIIESSAYRPTFGDFKIFIVDEVHMLSKSAFNALLKTLEEPPPHVKFLFATTETHKIPKTVTSRVLRFDLKKPDGNLIAQHLSSVCNREGIAADAETLALIAKAADGSIRDGLSILDQAVNVSENETLSICHIKDMLNVSDDNDTVDLLELILFADIKSSVSKYREIIGRSGSAEKIINALADFVYALTCLKTNITPPEQIISENLIPRLKKISEEIALSSLSVIWQMLIKGTEELRFCDRADIIPEMILIRIAYASGLPDLGKLMNNLVQDNGLPENKKIFRDEGDDRKTETISLVDEALKMFSNAKTEQDG